MTEGLQVHVCEQEGEGGEGERKTVDEGENVWVKEPKALTLQVLLKVFWLDSDTVCEAVLV